jgi:hypothetical protein
MDTALPQNPFKDYHPDDRQKILAHIQKNEDTP